MKARLDRVPSMRGFSWTMIAFVVALCVSWLSRTWFLGFWLSPLLDVHSRFDANQILRDRAGLERAVTIATALSGRRTAATTATSSLSKRSIRPVPSSGDAPRVARHSLKP